MFILGLWQDFIPCICAGSNISLGRWLRLAALAKLVADPEPEPKPVLQSTSDEKKWIETLTGLYSEFSVAWSELAFLLYLASLVFSLGLVWVWLCGPSALEILGVWGEVVDSAGLFGSLGFSLSAPAVFVWRLMGIHFSDSELLRRAKLFLPLLKWVTRRYYVQCFPLCLPLCRLILRR